MSKYGTVFTDRKTNISLSGFYKQLHNNLIHIKKDYIICNLFKAHSNHVRILTTSG